MLIMILVFMSRAITMLMFMLVRRMTVMIPRHSVVIIMEARARRLSYRMKSAERRLCNIKDQDQCYRKRR